MDRPAPRRPLYPSEPRPVTSPLQIELSQRFLEPALPALVAYFLAVRLSLDPIMEARQPSKLGKPYPLGQCLEIARAAEHAVRDRSQPHFDGVAGEGRRAYVNYMAAGGVFRRVWGDLRGKFFQNAFQLGTLYVDVSNDTVTPTKPKVEILPFAEAGLNAMRDFGHFREIVQLYWGGRTYPNHLLPELAPYCPVIHINEFGIASVREPTDYMVAMTRGDRFASAQAILAEPAMPEPLFRLLAAGLAAQNCAPAASIEAGRRAGIEKCRKYRAKRWYANETISLKWIAEATRLKPIQTGAPKAQPHDARVMELKASLQATDQEIAELEARLAIARTARAAYARSALDLLAS